MMKKILIFTLAVGLTWGLTSCQSDSPSIDGIVEPVAKTGVVKFAVSTEFNESLSGLRGADYLPEDSYIRTLDYIVYNKADGKLVKNKRLQKASDDKGESMTLNMLSDTLAYGDYTVCMIATAESYNTYYLKDMLQNYKDGFLNFFETPTDTFLETFDLTVNGSTNKVDVALPRIVSKIEINILDLPEYREGVSNIRAIVGSEAPVFYYPQNKTVALDHFEAVSQVWYNGYYVLTYNDTLEQLNWEEDAFVAYMLPSVGHLPYNDPEINLYLDIVMKDGNHYTKLIKKDFKTYRNKITRLSGNLFTNDNVGVDPSVDTEWGETIEESFD